MQKKKVLLIPLALLLAMGLVAAGCPPVDPEVAEPEPLPVIELTFASFWPPAHKQVVEGHAGWIEDIERATGGRVDITLHPGGILLKSGEMFAGVVGGVADIGVAAYDYTPGRFPLMGVFGLPGWHAPHCLASTLTAHRAWERLRHIEELAAEVADVKVLMHFTAGGSYIISTKPIRTLEDLQGLEIRALGATAPTMAALGAIPVAMPMPDVYHALEVGIIDAYVGPTNVIPGFRLFEVAHYIIPAPFLYNLVFFKVMDIDAWNALPEDIQAIFETTSHSWMLRYGELRSELDVRGLELGLEEGMDLIHLPLEEKERWLEIVLLLREEWVAEMEAEGLPARQILDVVIELDEKHAGK